MFSGRAIAVLCLLGAAPASAQMVWGVNGHPITAYPGIGIDRQLDFLKDLGMTSYRVNVPDAGGAPVLAELVREGRARGIDILPVITPGDVDLDADSTADLYSKSYSLAVSLASQFKDDIRVWELGNEMENYAVIKPCEMRDDGTQYPCKWGPAGGTTALDYFGPRWEKVSAVLKGLSEGITSVDPDIRKAIGTAGWGHTGAFERLRQDGIDWDISVWHMYGQDPEWAFKELAAYERPIWVTEFNNAYGSQPGEQAQADGLRLQMNRLLDLQDEYRIEAAYVYEIFDESYWAPDYQAFMGLVALSATEDGGWEPGEPKPAYLTVKGVISQGAPGRDCDLAQLSGLEAGPVRQISYMYCLALGRAPSEADLGTWTPVIENETAGVSDIMLAIVGSNEFAGRYSVLSLTDLDYVSFLYKLLLGRDADQNGLDSYAKELASGAATRAGVALRLINSSEFRSKHPACFSS